MANLGVRNNNPGNIKDPSTGEFRVFNTPQEGQQALIDDLTAKVSGTSHVIKPTASLADFAKVYAPASDKNNPDSYAKILATNLGVDTSVPIGSLSSRVNDFAHAISTAEGTTTLMSDLPKSSPTSSGSEKMSVQQFGELIQKKYPQYADKDATEIGKRTLEKYPQYQSKVEGFTPSPQFPLTAQKDTQGQSAPEHSGTLGTNPNDSTVGKVLDNSVTRAITNNVPGGTLGNAIGNSIYGVGRLLHGDVKGFMDAGAENSDNAGKIIGDTASAVATPATLLAGGNAVKGLVGGALKKGSALASEPVLTTLGKDAMNMSAAEKVETLTKAIEKGTGGYQVIFQRALQELAPQVLKEAGVGSFSELNPIKAKALGLSGSALKFLARVALDVAGIKGLSGLLK